ncbi:hypothetical protein [Pseudoalteromonas sp. M8]|uniref:hypothetical protein n=1 Tax=Pseudoalteromonas sp. M8 TaxID=2692624 RepID=UPI001BA4F547|nr:hypothetical protein [Pseudoalteromonas sp. M8]QUI72023.1 hypothetical protein GSF13_20840 [Pseudoalteromonas sp. M8]
MGKSERLELFRIKLQESEGESTAKGARDLMSELLKSIEDKHAPTDKKKMVISEVTEKTVQEYGEKGLYIPLIGHRIYINGNGAILINDFNTDEIFVEKENINGISFSEVSGWKPNILNV